MILAFVYASRSYVEEINRIDGYSVGFYAVSTEKCEAFQHGFCLPKRDSFYNFTAGGKE